MTLDTRFLFDAPLNPRDVFDMCRAMIGAADAHTWEHDSTGSGWPNPVYRNNAGQGLPALLYVWYGANGPLLMEDYGDEDSEDWDPSWIRKVPHDPAGFVLASFDTAYSYRGPAVLGCGELHAGYVAQLGRWCEEHGIAYRWYNEFTGEWHADWRNAHELGGAGGDAQAWMRSVALPAVTAEFGPVRLAGEG